MMKNIRNNEKGITLVALVVTIVVLLILAGISLNLVLGQNGIVAKSKEAREKGTQDQENTETALNTLYDEMIGAIDEDGNQGGTGLQFPDAVKHPEQSSTNNNIGIGTDGQPVNLDLWTYREWGSKSIALSGEGSVNIDRPGYDNANIVEGKIQGKVPQYIKLVGRDEFYPVTGMNFTFSNCSSLTTPPEIPSCVTGMMSTFHYCSSLTTAPTIPSSVVSMQGTFTGCSSLTTAPTIPSSVTNMYATFSRCSGLTTAPTIPSDVTDMTNTFSNCSALTGNIEINANPTRDTQCFYGAATNEGTNLIVSGTSTKLDEIIATKSENSNITKAE